MVEMDGGVFTLLLDGTFDVERGPGFGASVLLVDLRLEGALTH